MDKALEQGLQNTCTIYFSDKVFGKATKHRSEDPSMFQLLRWGADGFEKHCFKKSQKFEDATQTYMNSIGKRPWTSQTKESYVNYHEGCVVAHPQLMHRIEGYIQGRAPGQQRENLKVFDQNVREVCQGQKKQRKGIKKVGKQKFKQTHKAQGQRRQDSGSPGKVKEYQTNKLNNALNPKQINTFIAKNVQNKAELVKVQKNKRPMSQPKQILKHVSPNTRPQKNQNARQDENHPNSSQKLKNSSQILVPQDDSQITQQVQQKLIQNFKQTTRWIPNSSFTTYFGRPPFENYGRGNTKPTVGGLGYGSYLYSHNVHPHRGSNQPKHLQTYSVALMKAKSQGILRPTHPRTRPEEVQLPNNSGNNQFRSKIEPELNNVKYSLGIEVPVLEEMSKFGGKKLVKDIIDMTIG